MTKTANPVKFYKILNPDMTPCHGGTGRYHKPVGKRPGKWMPVVDVKPCETGYHTATAGQMTGWLKKDAVVWECEPSIDVIEHGVVKHVSASVRLVRPVGKITRDVLVTFAADCAERVLPIFEEKHPNDKRPRLAIEAARKGAASIAGAAANAAYAASRAAYAYAAYAASRAYADAYAAAADADADADANADAYAAYAAANAAYAASRAYADAAAAAGAASRARAYANANADAYAASTAANAATAATAATADAVAERTWQGERLLQILSQQNGAK